MTNLSTDAVLCCLQICENFASDGHKHIVDARIQLQALLDENKRLTKENYMLAWESTPIPKLLEKIANKDARIVELMKELDGKWDDGYLEGHKTATEVLYENE